MPIPDATYLLGGQYGFHLVEGTRYRLRVLEWCKLSHDVTMPRLPIECDFNDGFLTLEGSRNLIVGRYDVLEYTFVGLKPGYTELSIRVEGLHQGQQAPGSLQENSTSGRSADDDKGRAQGAPIDQAAESLQHSWPVIYAARVPVIIKHHWGRIIGMGLVGLTGLLMYFLADRFQEGTYAGVLQPIGILLAFVAAGSYLERFLKLNREMSTYSSHTTPTAPPKS